MPAHPTRRRRAATLAALALLASAALLAPRAQADRGEHEDRGGRDSRVERGTRSPATPLPAYQQECAACHLAYPPGLLPAVSWQRLMAKLPRHFGSDASLDAALTQQISTWLVANAGTDRKVARNPAPPPQDRITQAAWFVREHDEIGTAVFQRKAIGSAANCAACHRGAAQGQFNEHDVRIPK